jgi:peroxiredoxin
MRPLGAGDPAPTFMLPDPDDVMISSAELLENGPLVVTFYRGIWCPYCRQDLKDLGNAAPDIRSCGASLVAIAHQTVPDSNGKFQREHGLEFPILDDRQGDVAVAYRIRWSLQELAASCLTSPVPANAPGRRGGAPAAGHSEPRSESCQREAPFR